MQKQILAAFAEHMPSREWRKQGLSPRFFRTEILAGLTVALALVPEAVAFAFVAGVHPLVGLYAAFIVGLITALIGGRPGMISGRDRRAGCCYGRTCSSAWRGIPVRNRCPDGPVANPRWHIQVRKVHPPRTAPRDAWFRQRAGDRDLSWRSSHNSKSPAPQKPPDTAWRAVIG